MNSKLLGVYKNGNYMTSIYSDGTKVRETLVSSDTEFIPDFPECMDVKITNFCDMGCKYCHEDSTMFGVHGGLLNTEFINTLSPYTEMAIGGGNPLEHPQLMEFLKLLKSRNIIANITVNQTHFLKNISLIDNLIKLDLIKGIGVSFTHYDKEFIETAQKYSNLVIHIINGIIDYNSLKKMYNRNLKLLILGYKNIRRGIDFYNPEVEENKKLIYDNISEIIKGFKITSFDNLAIKQLELKRIFTNKDWEEFYMGDDGQFTLYIDLVKQEFAKSSTSQKRHSLMNDIISMFNVVRKE